MIQEFVELVTLATIEELVCPSLQDFEHKLIVLYEYDVCFRYILSLYWTKNKLFQKNGLKLIKQRRLGQQQQEQQQQLDTSATQLFCFPPPT